MDAGNITTDPDEFFARSLYNSCQATDELMKHIDRCQLDSLAKRALHLYQKHYLSLKRPWEHVTFMYGLGLIYMHFNAYSWAVKAFREAIYVQPSFLRARDVHTRLGLIFKAAHRYRLSEKHFRLAMNDKRQESGTSSQLELQFHLAHLSEVRGNLNEARLGYEKLLQQKNLTHQLSANINRQLGCLYLKYNTNQQRPPQLQPQTTTANNNNNSTIGAALKYFNASHQNDPKTSYYLGRYLTEIGKHQEAFASYRSIIDRGESTADTWCSIGVLYQRQNQLTDALQAYIRSVQFDKQHSAAWMNLGILYENHLQFQDALKCYQHCLRSRSNGTDKMLLNRIRYLQKQISCGKTTLNNSNGKSSSKLADSDRLISLEDLWNLESSLVKNRPISETPSTTSISISPTSANCDPVPSQTIDFVTPNFISAEQVIEACRNCPRPSKYDINLLDDDNKPPVLFSKYPPYPPSDKLYPSPPSIFLETKKDLTSKKIQECCSSNPISIIRNLASVLKLDLGLFSTKTLVESNSEDQVDLCRHQYHRTDDGLDSKSWLCERQKSTTTIGCYANYQVGSFRETLQEEIESKLSNSKAANTIYNNNNKESETDSNESASIPPSKRAYGGQISGQTNSDTGTTNNTTNNQPAQHNQSSTNNINKKLKKEPQSPKPIKYVQSAENIDLSDDNKWRLQLNELNKLPNFIKCISASNMLTHIGSPLPGINSTVMGMHVPGCRLSDTRVPNNFCSVNINIGPGDYEWCAISAEYCSALTRLCNNRGLDFEDKNWWPNIDDLKKHRIPIYRFSQRPGDMVWINSGTMYWIQAIGWCNNIHWNVGPLSSNQYKLAAGTVEINKFVFSKSEVPMIQLTWNLVININIIPDNELSEAITNVLRRSLRYCFMVEELTSNVDNTNQSLTDDKKPVICAKMKNSAKGPMAAKFCTNCESEVFNIYFIKERAQHCIECARQSDPSLQEYSMRQDYDLSYLMQLYDGFIETRRRLHSRDKQQC